jgi:hypothetical protein
MCFAAAAWDSCPSYCVSKELLVHPNPPRHWLRATVWDIAFTQGIVGVVMSVWGMRARCAITVLSLDCAVPFVGTYRGKACGRANGPRKPGWCVRFGFCKTECRTTVLVPLLGYAASHSPLPYQTRRVLSVILSGSHVLFCCPVFSWSSLS